MGPVTALGYAVLGVSQQDAWDTFLVDYLGLVRSAPQEGEGEQTAYRVDEQELRLITEPSSADDLLALGMEVADRESLAALKSRLKEAGHEVETVPPDICRRRRVDELLVVSDPDGNKVELFHTPHYSAVPFASSRLQSKFVTGGLGLGHAVLATAKIDEMRVFYCDLLGFGVSDYIDVPVGPGIVVEAVFLHCNPRHHSLALLPAPLPKRLVHLMLEVEDFDDVGRLYQQSSEHGVKLTMSLGRHTNDKMLSYYMETPSGFELEFGSDGLHLDTETCSPVRYNATSIWGHERL